MNLCVWKSKRERESRSREASDSCDLFKPFLCSVLYALSADEKGQLSVYHRATIAFQSKLIFFLLTQQCEKIQHFL